MYKLALTLAKGGSIKELEGEYNITGGKYVRLPYYKVTKSNIGDYLSR